MRKKTSFEELMYSLEAEFRKQAPGLPVAEGEETSDFSWIWLSMAPDAFRN